MKKIILPLVIAVTSLSVHMNAQVGVNTQTPASTLDVQAKTTGSSAVVEGLLIPRVDRQKAQSMTGVPTSTMIYINNAATGTQTATALNIDAEGYYFFNGTVWTKLAGNTTPPNNIYTNDGTLAGDRIVTQADKTLSFTTDNTKVNAFSVDSGTLSVDALNNRVGIGNTAPNGELQLSNTTNNRKIVLYDNNINNDHQYYGFGVNGNLLRYQTDRSNSDHGFFSGSGAATSRELMRIKGNGNVGIGTGTPGTTLDVNGAITNRETTVDVAGNAATVAANTSQVQLTGAATADVTLTAAAAPNAGQRLIVYNNTTGGFGATFGGSTILNGQAVEFIYSNGAWRTTDNGASNPAVAVNWRMNGNTGTNATNNFIGTTDIRDFVTRTNNTERMRVTSAGNVGIGTTTAGTTLDVNGAITNRETIAPVSVNEATIAANTSQVQLTGIATANVTVTAAAAPNAGQRLVVYNNTIGGFGAIFSGNTILNGQAVEFIYSNGAWRTTDNGASNPSVIAGNNWRINGNAGTNATNNFIGTTDNTGFVVRTNNTERVRVDQNGNVGIGTATPNAPLQFANTAANRKVVLFDNQGTDNQYYGFGINGNLLRYQTDRPNSDHGFFSGIDATTSRELMRIKGNGNVGIGTATPQKMLHVTGTTQFGNEINVGGSATTAGNPGTAGQLLASGGAGAAPTWTNVTDINTNIYTNDGALNGNRTVTQAANALAFTGTGNVGLGVANPAQKLSVLDGTNANQYSGIASFLPANSTQGVGIGWAGIQKIGTQVNSDLNLNAAGTGNVALITQGTGNVTVGTRVGIGNTAPNAPLQFTNAIVNRKIVLYESNNNDNEFHGFGVSPFILRYQVPAVSNDHVFFAATSSTASNELFRIRGNGNATLAGSLTQNSDIRLKKDIVDNMYGLSEISKLRTINYRFKDEQRGTDKKIGFIAQEIKAAMPELVSTANDEMKTLSVSYPEMTVVLTKAVQELQELVKSQQKQIDELKAQITPKP